MKTIKKSLFLTGVVLLVGLHALAVRTVSFEDAVRLKLIEYTGFKGIDGRAFVLDVVNKTRDSLCVQVETGRVFLPHDPRQPQVVTCPRDIFVSAGEKRSAGLNTVCGNASLGAPKTGYNRFEKTTMAHSELVRILEGLVELRLDQRAPTQQLVWMYTNNHGVHQLCQGRLNAHEYAVLLALVKDAKGSIVDPGYRVMYREPNEDEEQRFTGEPEHLSGSVTCALAQVSDVMITLNDAEGRVVRTVRYITGMQAGEAAVPFRLDVTGLPAGDYHLQGLTAAGEVALALPITM